MDKKVVRIHDFIVGALLVAGTLLGFYVSPLFFWLPAAVGALMIVSTFTGFCPVYAILGLCGLKA
jgi:hypothetical protein